MISRLLFYEMPVGSTKRNADEAGFDEVPCKEPKMSTNHLDNLFDYGHSFSKLADECGSEFKLKCEHENRVTCSHCRYKSFCSECQPLHLNAIRMEMALLTSSVMTQQYIMYHCILKYLLI